MKRVILGFILGIVFLASFLSAYPVVGEGNAPLKIVGDEVVLATSTDNLNIGEDDLFVDTSLGRVGIGTASPSHELNVIGDSNITGNIYVGNQIIINGTNFTGGHIPQGALVQFDQETCPVGWIPADGTSGTPNLVNITIDGQSVLRKQYVEGVDDGFNVTGTDWTTTRAVAVPYQTSDGAWRLKFNFAGTLSSGDDGFTLTISGVTFKNGYAQGISVSPHSTAISQNRAIVLSNSSTFSLSFSASTTGIFASGDVELDSKPDWADEDSTLMYCQKAETDSSESDSFWQRVGDIISLANLSNILHVGDTIQFDTNLSLFANTTSIFYNNGSSTFNLVQTETPGQVVSFNQETCPLGWVLADGDNGTPDLRGIFVRGSGVSGVIDYANGTDMSADFGEYLNDSFQGHSFGELPEDQLGQRDDIASTGSASGAMGHIDEPSVKLITTSLGPEFGEPRTGAETAPASYAMIYCVKTAEDTQESNSIWQTIGNIVSLVNSTYSVLFEGDVTVEGDLNVTGNFVANKQYVGGVDFTVTGEAGFALRRAVLIPYQTSDGAWRLKGNINTIHTSGVNGDIIISGITYKDAFDQTVAATIRASGASVRAWATLNTNRIEVKFSTATTITQISFDVELNSKPDWAD